MVRAVQGRPPCIRVVNEHTEEIDVVVSKSRPSRLWTGSEVNASASGGGFSMSTEVCLHSQKIRCQNYAYHSYHYRRIHFQQLRRHFQPLTKGRDLASGTFPLWNRKQGFGVVSIFVGPEKRLFIENDRVPIGAEATFNNRPDLNITMFKDLASGIGGKRKTGLSSHVDLLKFY